MKYFKVLSAETEITMLSIGGRVILRLKRTKTRISVC